MRFLAIFSPLVAVVLLVGGVAGLISFDTENLCRAEIAREHFSPNGKLRAIIYQFDCGATTAFTTQISVLASDEAMRDEPGNAFTAYCGEVRGDWGGPYSEVRWLGNDILEISYVSDAEVTRRSSRLQDTEIRYVELK